MPPPTSSLKPNAPKTAPAPSKKAANGTAPADGEEKRTTLGKPDQSAYNAEQDNWNKEIAALKSKQVRSCPLVESVWKTEV